MLIYSLCRQLSRVEFTHFLTWNPPECQDWGAGRGGQTNLGNARILRVIGTDSARKLIIIFLVLTEPTIILSMWSQHSKHIGPQLKLDDGGLGKCPLFVAGQHVEAIIPCFLPLYQWHRRLISYSSACFLLFSIGCSWIECTAINQVIGNNFT